MKRSISKLYSIGKIIIMSYNLYIVYNLKGGMLYKQNWLCQSQYRTSGDGTSGDDNASV